jgi:hypothetical protein
MIPKTPAEVYRLEFQFKPKLLPSEIIRTATVDGSVKIGTGDSEKVLLGTTIISEDGKTVWQRVQKGIPGKVYQFQLSAVTSLGNEIEETKLLLIVPGTQFNPPLLATYFTSQIYPIFDEADFRLVSVNNLDGDFLEVPTGFFELTTLTLTSGELRDVVQTFTQFPEDFFKLTGITLPSGSLDSIIKTFTQYPEDFYTITQVNLVSGSLTTVVIQFTQYPEDFFKLTGVTLVSGTLA